MHIELVNPPSGRDVEKLTEAINTDSLEKNISTLRTMSFQTARAFYEKLGYVVQYEEKGYVNDHVCFYMVKSLKA